MPASIKTRLAMKILKKDRVVSRVYQCGQHNDRFSDCLEKAPEDLRQEYNRLRSECIDLESEAVLKGKAWRNSLGSLTFYR